MKITYYKVLGAVCTLVGMAYAYKIPRLSPGGYADVFLLIVGLILLFPKWNKKKDTEKN